MCLELSELWHWPGENSWLHVHQDAFGQRSASAVQRLPQTQVQERLLPEVVLHLQRSRVFRTTPHRVYHLLRPRQPRAQLHHQHTQNISSGGVVRGREGRIGGCGGLGWDLRWLSTGRRIHGMELCVEGYHRGTAQIEGSLRAPFNHKNKANCAPAIF